MDNQYGELAAQYSKKPDGYYELSRPEMLDFVPASSKSILEVGCSSGGFGALLKERDPGREVWGIEPDAEAARTASARLDRVIAKPFSSEVDELQGKRFDAICFFDVLEHLVNPEKALKDCRNFLTENGVVVASIPNILHFYQISEILIQQDWKYRDEGIMDNTHLRFFTKKSILRMFETCGFTVSRIEGISASYGLKYKLANMLTLGRLADWKYVQFAVVATAQ
jgi:2-polyprenyl-3-methyl-5-hydroxy-6-metoxy-1,4-benzoquinol methylase